VVTGIILAASYIISSLGFMNESLETAAKFMPYHYFQTVLSFKELNLTWLFSLLGISLLMIVVAWLRFLRRDIRLMGEGSWRLSSLARRKLSA
jgi:ABC-2 type transport system permease protein